MSLRPVEATAIAKELERELQGAVVQQVASPTSTRLFLELRVPGRTATLLLCSDERFARISAVDKRPANPPTPPGWQSVLRRELVGTRLLDVESVEARRVIVLHLRSEDQTHALVLEYGDSPGIALTTEPGRILALSSPFREGFRHGATWTPPAEQPVTPQTLRTVSDHVELRLARGSEAFFATLEQVQWRKVELSPLEAKLKRLDRTRQKVLEEANRTAQAEQYKREGELLAQNLHRLSRGSPSVTLTRYTEAGEQAETIALDPKRSPKEEVEWRFHQYRRLLRGVEFAKKRLVQLEEERARLVTRLEALRTESAVMPIRGERASDETPLLPYKHYVGHREHPIWVGRGATHNDTLTFRVARPWHVWFHARGVPGAHVVVPLEKRATLNQELLLDAAHLALHHSDAKGEPRGEVSYVAVKYVRKAKGAAAGAVTYTQEKTLMLRVEPERLARLLGTERLERS